MQDAERSKIPNAQFTSFFSEPLTDIDYTQLTLNSRMMTDIVIDKNGVRKQLKSLNPHKAAGPDAISPKVLLRELAEVLVARLTTL